MVTLSDVKTYLRIDFTDDDELIQSLILTANQYIANQTGKKYADGDYVWDMCVKLLCSHWYDTRALHPVKPGALAVYSHTVDALLTHIAICGLYPVATRGDS